VEEAVAVDDDDASLRIVCQQFVELVTDYLEGTLDLRRTRAMEAHLDICPFCVDYLDQVRETVALTGRLTPEALPPETRRTVIAAFRAVLPGPGGVTEPRSPSTS
jgi:predicted anti-sigma-YlaC factor YlaD